MHLRVELDAEDARPVREGRDRRVGARGNRPEALWQPEHLVSVAHPDGQLLRKSLEQTRPLADREHRGAVLALARGRNLASEVVRDQLHAVADPQDRHPAAQGGRVDLGRVGLVHGGGTAAQDQPGRPACLQLRPGRGARDELAVDARLSDAPGDQLRVLGPEVQDQDQLSLWERGVAPGRRLGLKAGLGQRPLPIPTC